MVVVVVVAGGAQPGRATAASSLDSEELKNSKMIYDELRCTSTYVSFGKSCF